MGRLLSRVSTVTGPSRMRAGTPAPQSEFWYRDPQWGFMIPNDGASGDLALTLSYYYSGVSIIADDFGSMTCQLFEDLGNDGKRRVQYGEPGIGRLATLLRWEPNLFQSAKAFWSTMAWQYRLRKAAYAEILFRPDNPAVIDQIVPRHPDRVRVEQLVGGRLRFWITDPGAAERPVNAEQMFYVPNLSLDGVSPVSPSQYGAKAISTGLALQDFTKNYFKKGATAAVVATYKGQQAEEEWEDGLHHSISRYMSGPDNAGGLLVIPEDIKLEALSVDAQKAELLGLKDQSGRDVARMLKMPPSWLGIKDATSYNSYLQDAQVYVNRCQIPMVVEFEQAIWNQLIFASRFYARFNMDYLLRADLKSRMEGYEIGIRARVLRPSECRVREDMAPDQALDKLSEGDNRPGTPRGSQQPPAPNARAYAIAMAAAQRVVRRETAAITKAAQKHAKDAQAFRAWADQFYADHAAFVAEAMGMTGEEAADYCEEQKARLTSFGLPSFSLPTGVDWEHSSAKGLAARALNAGSEAA